MPKLPINSEYRPRVRKQVRAGHRESRALTGQQRGTLSRVAEQSDAVSKPRSHASSRNGAEV
jgi:hypothetical protein